MFCDTVLNPYPDPDCNGFPLEGLTESERGDMLRYFDRDIEDLRFHAFTTGRVLTSVDRAEVLIMRRDRKDLLMVGCLGDDPLKANLEWARGSGRRRTRATGRWGQREGMPEDKPLPSIPVPVREAVDGVNNRDSTSPLSD